MLILISGQPGNGKTLRAMAEMLAAYDRDQELVKAGKKEPREFYTNVKGAVLGEFYDDGPGKPQVTNPNAFPWTKRMPAHNDWTQLPDGSYVQYDEAHSDGKTPGLELYGHLFPSTGKPGESDDPRVRALSTHRHRGFDIDFITQWPNKIHHQVRTLMGEHVHMNRAMGLSRAGVLKWSRVQVDPYDEKAREKSEEEIWAFPKSLYSRYISASIHSDAHKFRMPKKVWQALSMCIVALVIGWFLWFKAVPYYQAKYKEKAGGVDTKAESASGSALAPAAPASEKISIPGTGLFDSLTAPKVTALAGCVDTPRACRCWDGEGDLIDQSQVECRMVVDGPMPFNIYHEYKSGSGRQDATAKAGPVPTGTETASPSTDVVIASEDHSISGRVRAPYPATAN